MPELPPLPIEITGLISVDPASTPEGERVTLLVESGLISVVLKMTPEIAEAICEAIRLKVKLGGMLKRARLRDNPQVPQDIVPPVDDVLRDLPDEAEFFRKIFEEDEDKEK